MNEGENIPQVYQEYLALCRGVKYADAADRLRQGRRSPMLAGDWKEILAPVRDMYASVAPGQAGT